MTTELYYDQNDLTDVFNFELTLEQRKSVTKEKNRILKEEYHAFNYVVTSHIINEVFERSMMLKYYCKTK